MRVIVTDHQGELPVVGVVLQSLGTSSDKRGIWSAYAPGQGPTRCERRDGYPRMRLARPEWPALEKTND
jgi:hypothetical protein